MGPQFNAVPHSVEILSQRDDTQERPVSQLVKRLRANAQVCRDEQQRDLPLSSKAELANDAREWDEAADALQASEERIWLAILDGGKP